MRGPDEQTNDMFSYLSPEQRVRADHPLRAIRPHDRRGAAAPCRRGSARCTRTIGRPSIPPEQLLRALLLQALYTVRSERLLMEEIDYNVLFRWFVGLGMDDPIWSPTTFSKNRDRLLESDIASAFFRGGAGPSARGGPAVGRTFHRRRHVAGGVGEPEKLRRKDAGPTPPPDDPGNPTVNFHGEPRRNDTHHSTTDPRRHALRARARAKRRSCPMSVMCCWIIGTDWSRMCVSRPRQVLLNGKPLRGCLTRARRRAARSAGTRALMSRRFVAAVRALGITPHVAQKVDSGH